MKKLLNAVLLMGILTGCSSANHNSAPKTDEAEKHLTDGVLFASTGSSQKAVSEFDKVIEICNKKFSDKKVKVFASRDPAETIYYMAIASALKMDAVAVDTTCSDGLYYRGYAALDLGNIVLAQSFVERAIEMSPNNSMYLSELGHIHQTNKKWNEALEVFKRSEESAEQFSPAKEKIKELTRAKRGVGFALTELNRLDEAESKYKECLQIDPDDKSSMHELKYLESLRTKKS